jgi:hypothetical protein
VGQGHGGHGKRGAWSGSTVPPPPPSPPAPAGHGHGRSGHH